MGLTSVEQKLLEALTLVREYLTKGSVTKRDFYHLMETVRDGIKTGENKKYGCPMGKHSDYCTCKESSEGGSARYLRYGTYKKKKDKTA